ncbi:MAG TPA: bifunctional diaminohydroxyphosphoribosylaminopyrimidine deaminase/5-amino-6-(5-phosphoribosylamino)uracil reductase RibD [Actinomycetota bacterium]|nr:bifunctional diaminohydroxyphosphoribosylaminopyrimidine deaminase/5-amino-6-(5-phosphoribosylamino)uracil reductase RibD [Actinomycetota bacterium]
MEADAVYMDRAIELARSPVATSPNPRVGAVLVRDGVVLGEGVHLGAGMRHAEAMALEGVDARGATMYVNLEPCAHQGRMPPCAPALVEAGVGRVVVAIEDPDPRVSGAGVAYLRDQHVDVVTGVATAAATQVNRAYLHQRQTGRPLVTLKLALSLDGKLAAADGSARWITGPEARRRVHARRAECDALLVGAGTIAIDDPALTAREVRATRQPVRVVCDGSGRVHPSARVFAESGEVIVATTIACPQETQAAWKEAGAEILVVDQELDGRVDVRALFRMLADRGWLEIYCEGGAALATSLLRSQLVDRLELYQGPILLGGDGVDLGSLGIPAIESAMRWSPVMREQLGPDTVTVLERAP